MKNKFVIILPLLCLFFWGMLVSGGNNGALDAKLNTAKADCKELLNGARYEGSKTTYFALRKDKQVKSVEVFMFMSNEYIFAIGGKVCSAPLTVKIYDADADNKERILIKEFKKVEGSNLTFSSKDLNSAYLKKKSNADKLKNLFIEYHIGSGSPNTEGIVLVYGSK